MEEPIKNWINDEREEIDLWYAWLCARIPMLKESTGNKFYVKMAMRGYFNERSKPMREELRTLKQIIIDKL